MKRRQFIRKTALTAATAVAAPYILPSGRLFAATGQRLVNHVVYVLFGGGIRQQESVEQRYTIAQAGFNPPVDIAEGNLMENMLAGQKPDANLIYEHWSPVLSMPLQHQGTLFKEVLYKDGPTGHYNGHTVAMTGNYTETGLNLNINPEYPTIFEYYRRHTGPAANAMNAWWVSEGLGPYPSLNYSRHPDYGAAYGANYLRPATTFLGAGLNVLNNAVNYQPDDVQRINRIKSILDRNFDLKGNALPGITNFPEEREMLKSFYLDVLQKVRNGSIQVPVPGNNYSQLTGDLVAISGAWEVLDRFTPELLVVNTTNLDVCHSDFTGYVNLLHKADYGVGWLWNKIQSHPMLANDTIMICMPEHGRNLESNNLRDDNQLGAFDHTGDENSRRVFALVAGPPNKVVQGQVLGGEGNPVAESIDIVPTIAHILGFYENMPSWMLPGRVLQEAFL